MWRLRCHMKRSTAVNALLAVLVLLNLRLGLYSYSGALYSRSNSETTYAQDGTRICASATAAEGAGPCKNQSQQYGVGGDHSLKIVTMNVTKEMMTWASIQPGQVQILGRMRRERGFLTIGVPTISRINGNYYVMMTLESLINMTSDQEKREVVVVVFLADLDPASKMKTAQMIAEKHQQYISSGFIQIVQVSTDFYPNLNNLKRNFHDKPQRVKWRSKQVADYAFLFLHSANISQFYIQLEDDVISSRNYVQKIRNYIFRQRKKWTCLEFSELGFIGKLFKSTDLHKLAQFMLLFYDEQPVDWLIRYFRMTMTQPEVRLRKPTLFQHMGLQSSFDTRKANKLKDRFFGA